MQSKNNLKRIVTVAERSETAKIDLQNGVKKIV